MKQRFFFVVIFLIGLGIGAKYFADFVHQETFRGGFQTGYSPLVIVILVVAAIGLQLIGHGLRAYKSTYLLNPIRKAKVSVLFRGLSVGYLFNTLLPLRLGEVVRAFFVGDALTISKTVVFMSIVIERTLDSFILSLSIISAGLLIHPVSPTAGTTISKIGFGLFLVSLLLSTIIAIIRSEFHWFLKAVHSFTSLFNPKIRDRARFITWSGIYGTRLMLKNKKRLQKYVAVSLVMWFFYFASTACVAFAFFPNLLGRKLWYITQATYVGVSAPAGPGYLGTFHLILARLLTEMHLTHVEAFSLFMWLIIIAPISLIGLYVLLRHRYGSTKHTSRNKMPINKLYRERDISREFSHFLDAYLRGERINKLVTQAELENKFRLIKSYKRGSNAHTMLVWQKNGLRVKKLSLPQYADKLQAQAEWLHAREHLPHLPRVIAEDSSKHHYSFDLAYNENYIPFFEFMHSSTAAVNKKVIANVISFMRHDIYLPEPSTDGLKNVKSYIKTKVIAKANDTATINSSIGQLMTYAKVVINGKSYRNLLQIINKITSHKQALKDLADYQQSDIHGDLTVDNLIVSQDGDFLVLDPNNENQVSAAAVDYGKLYQSLHSGYEFLIQLERCEVKDNIINFEESISQKYAEAFSFLDGKLKKELTENEYKTILFHEAVHYCRMLTYRAGIRAKTLPVFYATAVKVFNEFLAQYE